MTITKLQTVRPTPATGNPLTSTVFAITPTMPGSCLVVYVSSFGTTASPTTITVTSGTGGTGGSFAADNWASASSTLGTAGINTGIWIDPNATAGTNAITVATNGSNEQSLMVIVEEWAGLLLSSVTDATATPLRQSVAGTTWSVGATGTTAQANELVLGCAASFLQSSAPTQVAPGSPWTEETKQTVTNGSSYMQELSAGYQVVSATGTFTYNGTSASCKTSACIVTLKGANDPAVAVAPVIPPGRQAPMVFGYVIPPPPPVDPTLRQNFAEGTNGGAVTTSNTGGPTQFDSITNTGGSLTFDTSRAHNGTSSIYLLNPAGVSSQQMMTWNVNALSSAQKTRYVRTYLWWDGTPPSDTNIRLIRFVNGPSLRMDTTGKLALFSGTTGNPLVATMASVMPANQWVRVEVDLTNYQVSSSTSIDCVIRQYSGANLESQTADQSISSTGNNNILGTGSQTLSDVNFGEGTAVTETSGFNLWYDDMATSDIRQPALPSNPVSFGPVPQTTPPPYTPTVVPPGFQSPLAFQYQPYAYTASGLWLIESPAGNGTTTATVTLGQAYQPGDLLVIHTFNTPNTATFTLDGTTITPSLDKTSGTNMQAWSYAGATTGTSLVCTGTGGSVAFVTVQHFRGFQGTPTLDQAAQATGTSTALTTNSITPKFWPSAIAGAVAETSTSALTTAGSPWSETAPQINSFEMQGGGQIQTPGVATAYSVTAAASVGWRGIIVSYYDNLSTPNLNVTAGLATGVGAALDGASGMSIGLTPPVSSGTGAAQAVGGGLTSGLSTGAGAVPFAGTGLTPPVASGTGTAQTPGESLAIGLASGTGASQAPGSGLTPGLATGTGAADTPHGDFSLTAVLASGTGAALAPTSGLTAGLPSGIGAAQAVGGGLTSGLATGAGASPFAGPALTPGLASGTGAAQAPPIGLTPALATGTGTSQAPTIGLTPALATGTGTALNALAQPDAVAASYAPVPIPPGFQSPMAFQYQPSFTQPPVPSLYVTAGLATGTGTALGPGIGLTPPVSSGTGAAQAVGGGITSGLATGAGQSQFAGPGLTPGLASGTGAAKAPGSGLTPGIATGTGAAQGPAAAGFFTHVGTPQATQATTGVTTVSVTLTEAINVGDIICVNTGLNNAGGLAANMLSDNASLGTWALGTAQAFGGTGYIIVTNAAPSGATITLTNSSAAGTMYLSADHFSVAAGYTATFGNAANGGAPSGTSGNMGSLTTVPAGALLWGGLHADDHNAVLTPGSSNGKPALFGVGISNTSGSSFSQYVLYTTGGTESLTWTSSVSLFNGFTNGEMYFTAHSSTRSNVDFTGSTLSDPNTLGGTVTVVDNLGGTCAPVDLLGGTCTVDTSKGGTLSVDTSKGGTLSVTSDTLTGTLTVVVNALSGMDVTDKMQEVDITLNEFNDATVTFQIKNNGSPMDITGYTVNALFKKTRGDLDNAGTTKTYSSGGGSPKITINTPSTGSCTLAIPEADMIAPVWTFYRIDIVSAGSVQTTAIFGTVTVTSL